MRAACQSDRMPGAVKILAPSNKPLHLGRGLKISTLHDVNVGYTLECPELIFVGSSKNRSMASTIFSVLFL
jgi:hypothetical protein